MADTTISSLNTAIALSANNFIPISDGTNTTKLGTDSLFGFRNKIINGGFQISQRGTSFTSPNLEYTLDRWRSFTSGPTSTKSVSQTTLTQVQADLPTDVINFANVTVSSPAGVGFISFDQPIEDVRTLAGKTVTASFWAKGSISGTVKLIIQNYFGSGGSSGTNSDIVTGTLNVSTTWTRYVITLNVPNIVGKTIGAGSTNDVHFVLYADSSQVFGPQSYTGTLSLANVQIEEGPTATPFERRPIGTELALCQRYYYQTSPADYQIYLADYTNGTIMWHSFPQYMRRIPDVSALPTTSLYIYPVNYGATIHYSGIKQYFFYGLKANAEL